jgi:hypothetical protein
VTLCNVILITGMRFAIERKRDEQALQARQVSESSLLHSFAGPAAVARLSLQVPENMRQCDNKKKPAGLPPPYRPLQ